MLACSPAWAAGNIGYRRAQLRGERYLELSDQSLLTFQSSINTDIATDTGTAAYAADHAGWPVLEGRVALALGDRGPGCLPVEFGVSSHIGEQIYDFRAPYFTPETGAARRTWSLNFDWKVPVTERFGIQGEFFAGENLGAFLGGILQSVDVGTIATPGSGDTIRSRGGWFEVWYDWTSQLHSHVGYAIDDPFDQDVTVGRLYNSVYFANMCYDLTSKFQVGLEFSSWKTLWAGANDGDSQRVEFVAKYGF
jgi:hypothetical protein